VVVIIGIAAAMAVFLFGRQKSRQEVDQTALELRALMNGARQTAFATGQPVALVVFPDLLTSSGRGRFILYRDGNFSLFSAAAAVNLENLDGANPAADSRSEVLDTVDLPRGMEIGPLTGQGPASVMPAPFAGIAINVACGVCTGAGRRGAFVFQPNGSVTFQDRNGPPLARPQGASISITKTANTSVDTTTAVTRANTESWEVRTIVVAASTGAMQTLKWDPPK